MAKNQVPLRNPNPVPEFLRENTTAPTQFVGEIPRKSPNPVPEFTRVDTTLPSIASTEGDVPNISPNPKPEFLYEGQPVPVALPDTNLY